MKIGVIIETKEFEKSPNHGPKRPLARTFEATVTVK